MKTKTKYIWAMLAVCILIVPVLSQIGDGKDGGPGDSHGSQDSSNVQRSDDNQKDSANKPRLEGCSTRRQEMKANQPIKRPSSNMPSGSANRQDDNANPKPDDNANPWAFIGQDDGSENHAEKIDMKPLFSDQNQIEPPKKSLNNPKNKKNIRSLWDDHPFPLKPPRKSLNDRKHKKNIRSLWDHNPFPPEPPRKSLNDHKHKKKIRPLWDDYPFPLEPPMKSIMGFYGRGVIT